MFRAIVLGVAFISCFLQSATPEYENSKGLKGLEKVGVDIVIIDVGAELSSLKKDFADQVTSFLKEHEITPVSLEEAQALPGKPVLRITFSFQVDMKNNVAAVHCDMALIQQATMVRDTSIEPVAAKTWDNSSITLIQPKYIQQGSQFKLDDFLEQFITDLYKANGKLPPNKKSKEKAI